MLKVDLQKGADGQLSEIELGYSHGWHAAKAWDTAEAGGIPTEDRANHEARARQTLAQGVLTPCTQDEAAHVGFYVYCQQH